MLHVGSNPFTRTMAHWPDIGVSNSLLIFSDFINVDEQLPPAHTAAEMVLYNSFYTATPEFIVQFQNIYLTTTTLAVTIKVQPNAAVTMEQGIHTYYAFRFYLEGVNVNCGAITSFTAVSSAGGAAVNLINGAVCAGKNYFYYHSYTDSIVSGRVYKTFSSTFPLGGVFEASEYIIFTMQMNVLATAPPTDPSWTRDWVAAKVFVQTSYMTYFSCCSWFNRYRVYNGYG